MTKDCSKSWVVLLAVTFMTFFVMGSIKSFGVLIPTMKEQLNTDTWIVGSCVAIILTWGYIIGKLHGLIVFSTVIKR